MEINEPLIPYLGKHESASRTYLDPLISEFSLPLQHLTYRLVSGDKLMLAQAIREGIPFSIYEEIKQEAFFTEEQWAEWLGVNVRTLQRYRNDPKHTFKAAAGERIFEIAEVYFKGKLVFDTSTHFQKWLNMPSVALGREKPIRLLDSSYGKELVLAELDRIEYGVFV